MKQGYRKAVLYIFAIIFWLLIQVAAMVSWGVIDWFFEWHSFVSQEWWCGWWGGVTYCALIDIFDEGDDQ